MSTELLPVSGAVMRQEFGASQAQSQHETAIAAVTARERARVEALYVMAERHPRSWDSVRVRLLSHCERPRFAEIAKYRKPVGNKEINGQWVQQYVEGPSARLAETAAQEMTNLAIEAPVTYEDDKIRVIRPSVIDLERNIPHSCEVAIAKAVERRGKKKRNTDGKNPEDWDPPAGREVISKRLNSYGEPVFLVVATEDEIRMRQNSEISKAQRNFIMKLLPRDILDEAMDRIEKTLNDPNKIDPTEAKKRLIDSFAAIGVMPDDLVNYIGHKIDSVDAAELKDLRGLYVAIHSGETTFKEAMKAKYDTSPDPEHEETREERDARNARQIAEQGRIAAEKIEKAKRGRPPKEHVPTPTPAAVTGAPVTQQPGFLPIVSLELVRNFAVECASSEKRENGVSDPPLDEDILRVLDKEMDLQNHREWAVSQFKKVWNEEMAKGA